VDEFHELPKQSQREIRAELDYPWSDSFIIGTCSTTKGIDPALLNRMYPIYVQPPSKTPLIAWIESICRKTGIEVIDSKAAGLLADLTGGRFRAMKMCLQRIYDTSGGKLAEDDVRKACRACGYSPTEFASTRLHQRAEKRE
jgi:DNA polymerase III delta subunit